MVGIQCPHCDEDIELENDVFGLFDCPHCDEEFEWRNEDSSKTPLKQLFIGFTPPMFFLALSMIFQESEDMIMYLYLLSFASAIFMIIKGYILGDKWTWKPLLYIILLTPPSLIIFVVAYLIILQPDVCVGFCGP